ncbi:uncharacterized protein NPIL_299681 [Nephila pilipes]|uniref:Uncharacterized protein n=1 Tax=Nephila pilipes TaxID=299642 RepID=A0A8X6MUB8_NEPPI|nr:uncharacterized protein NPIL_299681 [Nephila pilipes]
MNFFVLILFLIGLQSSKCSVFYRDSEKHCEFNLTDGIDKCEFNFTNGNFDVLSASLSELHECIKQCPHTEFLFRFENYTLPAFPNATFSNLHSRKLTLEISNGSKISLLSPSLPTYSIFINSSFQSVIFDIYDSTTLIGWNWSALESQITVLEKGFEFYAVRSKLVYLHPDFNKVAKGHITVVRILKCGLRWLEKNAFGPLIYLKSLELRDNLLENIYRSQLPDHAPEMRILDLGNNRITKLPQDIFDGLNLETVFLDGNVLKIIEPLMQNILSNKKLNFISGGIWPCKCEKTSILLSKFGDHFNEFECYDKIDKNAVFNYRNTCFV